MVDLAGIAILAGYVALAWYSRQTLGQPPLAPGLAFLAWVALPWLLAFGLLGRFADGVPAARMVLWALAFRLCGLLGVPLFEDDWFRYLWDGYRFAAAGTPYVHAPAEFFADPLVPLAFQRILDQVNYPDIPTIYGPVTEVAFLFAYLMAPGSLVPLQAILIGVDMLLIRLLLSVAPARFVLLYAWCPLVVKEIAFTAHPDGLGACLLIGAILLRHRGHATAAAACLACAVGAKVFALLLAPFVLARAGYRPACVFAVLLGGIYLPFALQGGTDLTALAVFAASWEFNSALFGLLAAWSTPTTAKALLGVALAVLGAVLWVRYRRGRAGAIPRGDWIYGAFLFAAPVVNPWYALWLLPFAVVHPSCWAWTASLALLLSYATALNLDVFGVDPFAHPAWVRPLEFGLVLAAAAVDAGRRWVRRAR